MHKIETGKKIDFDQGQPTKIDFENMTVAERRRLNFKKTGTKAFQPFSMKNIKKDRHAMSATFDFSGADAEPNSAQKVKNKQRK